MADSFKPELGEGYQSTKTYSQASPERRRQLNRYKKENNISDEHMYLLLFKQDLESVPAEDRNKGEVASNAMVVIGFLLLWSSLQAAMNSPQGANVGLIFLSVGSFVLVAAVYFLGLLNPYKRAVRELNKRMKDMPEVPDFVEWDLANPGKQDRKANKKRRR
jgi:cation transport ATPase